jgi:hypothetical protein
MSHIRDTTLRSLGSDMTMTRWTMALASLACAFELFGPWYTLGRPGMDLLRDICPHDWVWGILFTLHAVGVIWRIYDPIKRVGWAMAVNIMGFALFFILGITIDLSVGHFTLQSGVTFAISWVAFWSIVRTGNGADEVGT